MAGVNYIGNLIQSGHAKEAVLIASLPSHAKAVIVAEENMRTVALDQDAILAQVNAAAQDMRNPHLLKNAAKRAEQQALLALRGELVDEGAMGDRSGLEQDVKTAERILDQSKGILSRAVQTEQAKWSTLAKAQARFVMNLADTNAMNAVHTAFREFWNASTARKKAQQAEAGSQQALTDARQKLNSSRQTAMARVETQAGQRLEDMRLKLAEERAKLKEQAVGQDNDHQDGDGLPPLQSVDFISDRVSLLANRNGSGIIKEGRQQLESDAEMTLPHLRNTLFHALASAGTVTDVRYRDGYQDAQALDESDATENLSTDDLLNAVLTPQQREQKDKVTSLISGILSEEQTRRIENGEDIDTIIKELDPLRQDEIAASVAGVELMTEQQLMDFMYLQSVLLDGLTIAERQAILRHLNANNGQLTPADLKRIAADASDANAEGDFFKEVNQLSEDNDSLFDKAKLLKMPYRFLRIGTTFEDVNADYMAQKTSEAFMVAELSMINTVSMALDRWLFGRASLSSEDMYNRNSHLDNIERQGTTGEFKGSQFSWSPPEETSQKYYTAKAAGWKKPDGSTWWPDNYGFDDIPGKMTLQPGTRIDRYGNDKGIFTSPEGTPFDQRALAPGSENSPYSAYEVIKPFDVNAGKVVPWFDQPGGGTQYQLPKSIRELLDSGYIKIITK